MPAKVSINEKREYLQLYEDGVSEATIATRMHRDIKTVKKGISEARAERDLGGVRSQLLLDALKDHQNSLLEVLDNLRTSVVLPPLDVEIRWESEDRIAKIILPGNTHIMPDQNWSANFRDEQKLSWELLNEHLYRDKMWGLLGEWKQAMVEHLKARVDMKAKITILLEKKTGLKIVEDGTERSRQSVVYSKAEGLFYEVVLKRVLGFTDKTDPENNIIARPDGTIGIGGGGSPLAYSPDNKDVYRDKSREAFIDLLKSNEATHLQETYEELKGITAKASRAVEGIIAIRYIKGNCNACEQIGV